MLTLLRYRDIVALLCFVVLVQMSWHPHHQYNDSRMSGKFKLAWYTNTSQIITNPIVLDMNGDSNPDALLIPQSLGLQFLPITSSSNKNKNKVSSSLEYKSTIPTSTISYINNNVPLKIQGHYFLADKKQQEGQNNICGLNFKDASLHCHGPCPCQNSKYTCFSQVTNCFSQENDDEPCISIFNQPSNTLTMTCFKKTESQWQLRWKSPPLLDKKIETIQSVDWIISKETSSIILTITFLLKDENHQTSKTIYQSIQLYTGELQWSHDDNHQITKIMEKKKNYIPNTKYAFERRRSRISKNIGEEDMSMDCMHHYRYWMIQNAFPHNHQQQQSSLVLSHLHDTHSKLKQKSDNDDDETKNEEDEKAKKKQITISIFWKKILLNIFRHNNHTTTLPRNQKNKKPKMKQHQLNNNNVLIHHNHDGIHVRSLKNGQPICHVSLSPDKYFMDINHDNVVDEIQIYTPTTDTYDDDKSDEEKPNVHNNNRKTMPHKRDIGIYEGHKCSIVARSGIQLAQEELFHQQTICPEYHSHHKHDIDILPPLLVKDDIIVATSTGRIVSHGVHDGSLSWEQSNHPIKRSQQTLDEKFKLPTWSSTTGAPNVAMLQLIDFPIIQKISKTKKQTILASKTNHPNRPILFCGQDGCTLISSSNGGRLLSSIAFPQSSIYRPIVVDFNKDGIDDVIIFSQDGIWGFSVHFKLHSLKHTGKRILIVVLFIGISAAAAIHINNADPKTRGKRSTDRQISTKKNS